MWNSNDPDLWQEALNRYWTFVNPSNLALEKLRIGDRSDA
jgi:hypothetical protein